MIILYPFAATSTLPWHYPESAIPELWLSDVVYPLATGLWFCYRL
jgi:hypothetical protein